MRTTILPGLKAFIYYLPTLFAGMMLAGQGTHVPGFTNMLDTLSGWLAAACAALPLVSPSMGGFLARLVMLAGGVGVLLMTTARIKRVRKRRDFAIQHGQVGSLQEERPVAFAIAARVAGLFAKVAMATLAGALLLHSLELVPWLYGWICTMLAARLTALHPTVGLIVANFVAKVVACAITIELASWAYRGFVSANHAPIQTRFRIDGYMLPTRRFHPIALMARKSPLVLYTQSDRTRGLHGASVPVARITARPFAGGNETEHYILIRADLEPQRVRRQLTAADVDLVKDYLSNSKTHGDEAGQSSIAPRDIVRHARESNIFKDAFAGKLSHENGKISPADVGRILRELAETESDNVFDAPTEEVMVALRSQGRYAHGGRFFASVFDGSPLTPTVMLKENVGQTIACSRDPQQGFGPDFVRDRRLIMVLQHRRFQSGTSHDDSLDEWDDDDGDDDDHGDESSTPVNIIKEDRKAWNQILRSGFGEAYIIRMGDRQFIYDGCWLRSWELLFALIPGLRNRRLAPRRLGYVTDEKNHIVAKIADVGWKVPSKLLGNYDRTVDIYDARLARDKNFGLTLSLLSEFMTHQNRYRENRLQQILPTAGQATGADDDVAI